MIFTVLLCFLQQITNYLYSSFAHYSCISYTVLSLSPILRARGRPSPVVRCIPPSYPSKQCHPLPSLVTIPTACAGGVPGSSCTPVHAVASPLVCVRQLRQFISPGASCNVITSPVARQREVMSPDGEYHYQSRGIMTPCTCGLIYHITRGVACISSLPPSNNVAGEL